MEDIIEVHKKNIKLKNTIFIEGLPGIGNVGKLVAEHLIDELGAKKLATMYSSNFLHQVTIEDDNTVKLMKNDFFYYKGEKIDLLFLVGDSQPVPADSRGHYAVIGSILDFIQKYDLKEIFTLGGYATGRPIKESKVFGASTDIDLVNKYKEYGVIYGKNPGGAIVGASGLLIGLGMLRDINGTCLLGETHGYLPIADAKSAESVLKILLDIIGISVSLEGLHEKAEKVEKILVKLREQIKKQKGEKTDADDTTKYIG